MKASSGCPTCMQGKAISRKVDQKCYSWGSIRCPCGDASTTEEDQHTKPLCWQQNLLYKNSSWQTVVLYPEDCTSMLLVTPGHHSPWATSVRRWSHSTIQPRTLTSSVSQLQNTNEYLIFCEIVILKICFNPPKIKLSKFIQRD